MLRVLHRWSGLLAALLISAIAFTGSLLSVFPAAETLQATPVEASLTVAEFAQRVKDAYPGIEQIKRTPSGKLIAYWFSEGQPGSGIIDPTTGVSLETADPNTIERWLTNFHRSLFLDDAGRLVVAFAASTLLVLTVSGTFLIARRTGGWTHWFAPLQGPLAGRIHVEIARIAVSGMMLSTITALFMTASTFDLLPASNSVPAFPAQVSGGVDYPLTGIPALQDVAVLNFKELSFPYAGDANDVYKLRTDAGTGYIDQGNGKLLVWTDSPLSERFSETIYMLHTGKGASALGIVLGLMSLGVPVMAVSGLLIWISNRLSAPKLGRNASPSKAETIILVGSEGGSTWGFAATLKKALEACGQLVHVTSMSKLQTAKYHQANQVLILAATYGNGDAPASAKGFLKLLNEQFLITKPDFAILGFGDRKFPAYCAYAETVRQALHEHGWNELIPFETVDRQSPQDFARWGRNLSNALDLDLALNHQPQTPVSHELKLIGRQDFGADVQVPIAILRFEIPKTSLWAKMCGSGFSGFEAGDLLGVIPDGDSLPRFYSLASSASDGFIELAVRKHVGGLCSGQLMRLETGQSVKAFIRRNPDFRPTRSKAPLILIGAGTGIGPMAGFIRNNKRRRPIHLFFGARHPDSDFLYAQELASWTKDSRLTRLTTAFSRSDRASYVQDALGAEALEVSQMVAKGAQIMVCGGRQMAQGVSEVLNDILSQNGISLSNLKEEGRYVEDVY